MKAIPLTRARHASHFARVLENRGISSGRLLAQSSLTDDLTAAIDDDAIISAVSMLDFAERAAIYTETPDLGYWAGLAPVEHYGRFGYRVARGPSLRSAIRSFCDLVLDECSEADYFLSCQDGRAWFCHGPIPSGPAQKQHELYALMIMTQVVRMALGAAWAPTYVHLQQNEIPRLADNDFLRRATVDFGSAVTGVAFPARALAAPTISPAERRNELFGSSAESTVHAFSDDLLENLKLLVEIRVRQSRRPLLTATADAAGVSPRTLQRYLTSYSMTFSELVDEVRYAMAVPLLQDDSISISDIAEHVGYSHAGHFSRAFARITGMSPRLFRKEMENRNDSVGLLVKQ